MLRSILTVATLSFLFACGPQTASLTDDGFGEATSELTLAPAAAAQILAVVNYPGTDRATLDSKAGLDTRAAANIILYRNGIDGRYPSVDDNAFETIAELDALPYVGDTAFQKLLAFATANPPPSAEVVEGVAFEGWQAEIVIWAANTVDVGVLNGLLDNRAAANIVAKRPFTTVTQVGLVSLVGPVALQALRGQASTWWAARAGTPTLAGTFDGVTFDEATAKRALELANTASAADLFAHGMYMTGATTIVSNRPFTGLAQVAALNSVATATMQALANYAKEPVTPVTPPVDPGPSAIPEVKAALEAATAGLLMPSETDANFVFLTGTQLNGAPITVAVIRAQLTAQHDAQITNVMYTDPSERSLAAKPLESEQDAYAYLDRMVANADPNDDVSLANAQRFVQLKAALQANLTDVKMVRFGRISISTFFVGRTRTGELVALLTGQVET